MNFENWIKNKGLNTTDGIEIEEYINKYILDLQKNDGTANIAELFDKIFRFCLTKNVQLNKTDWIALKVAVTKDRKEEIFNDYIEQNQEFWDTLLDSIKKEQT